MKIEVQLGGTPLRRWHALLAERLTASSGAEVRFVGNAPPTAATPVDRFLNLERRLQDRAESLSVRIELTEVQGGPGQWESDRDLVLNLGSAASPDARTWHLRFDGEGGEAAALTLLRAGRSPLVTLVGAKGVVAAARPGTEAPGVLVEAFDDLLAGCTTLIQGAVLSSPFASPSPDPTSWPDVVPSLSRRVLRQLVSSAAHRTYRALYHAPHWRVGWRFVDGPGLLDGEDPETTAWRELPDDGAHFYADPFPFVYQDKPFLFVEDYEHRAGRGVISVVPFDEHGPVGVPEPVLRHDVHLSYPFVLAAEGEVWMIPETSGAGTVELYRAAAFPRRWTREAVLLKGIEASDATVVQRGDRWWMMATVRDHGSLSDALHVWSSSSLTGPWEPHANNPVLLDIASARPAGRVVDHDGRLVRPVQDGRNGYGAALALAEITILDERRFDQTVSARLHPGSWWPGRRLHTLNRAGRLECIDGSGMSPRFWQRRRRSPL